MYPIHIYISQIPIHCFFFNIFLKFIWLCRVLVAACGIFIVARRIFIAVRGIFRYGVLASLVATHGLLSSCGTWAPEHAGSVVAVCRLFSCGMWAQLPHGMWDLSSPTRDQIHVPCIGRQILNHWTTREVPPLFFKKMKTMQRQMFQMKQLSFLFEYINLMCFSSTTLQNLCLLRKNYSFFD